MKTVRAVIGTTHDESLEFDNLLEKRNFAMKIIKAIVEKDKVFLAHSSVKNFISTIAEEYAINTYNQNSDGMIANSLDEMTDIPFKYKHEIAHLVTLSRNITQMSSEKLLENREALNYINLLETYTDLTADQLQEMESPLDNQRCFPT